ncbi:nitric oxide reductase transcriptional regulator NorR [Marinomonas mediterranea]|uniref:nitric oxide reductase transcriptional regulator NorR n=1 Tax=Marinomonas mediterranea TaxID=119864 RepID=UPI00234900D5|nr:nitric oxide reductase transcriptional regulator NorR [Marinomonas mediterranea]WCN07478.1 nitric oxide reductase transcriptional regulator NorR [Marinomonas mediterranea]
MTQIRPTSVNKVTQSSLLNLAMDLASVTAQSNRFELLISAVRGAINCDAVVLLECRENVLVPLAQRGLLDDVLGRHFVIDEHPRLAAICEDRYPVRFAADSPLPDPYDGMVVGHDDLSVHSCMGIPLYLEGCLIGAVTLDSIAPNEFDEIDSRALDIIAAMAAMALNTSMLMSKLERKSHRAQSLVQALTEDEHLKEGSSILGQSEVMSKLTQSIELVAPSDFAVLIEGETGVGKELVARKLHSLSQRASAPMVYVNCAAIPQHLIESELFGHVKGAFTGADRDRDGKFLLADGGTLFLDEIGELPLEVQGTLLRAIQNQEIQAVGRDKTKNVDVRIIAATNRVLSDEVENKRFRADLFHRLSVFPVHVPPLRERQGDTLLLAGHFAEQYRRKLGLRQLIISESAGEVLRGYQWPGNVRELEHVISRAALLARSDQQSELTVIGPSHLTGIQDGKYTPFSQPEPQHSSEDARQFSSKDEFSNTDVHPVVNLKEATERYQKGIILDALRRKEGNWAQAARELSMDRANLVRLGKRLGITVHKSVVPN